MKKTAILLVVICPIIIILSFVSGCSLDNKNQSDYDFKSLEVKNKIAHFSFEYRTYYHNTDEPYVLDNQQFRFTALTIVASSQTMPAPNPEPGKAGETVSMSYTPASIGVNIGNALNQPFRPAQERISNSIASWSRWAHFKLIERKTVIISGIQGEMVSYEVDGLIGPKLLYQSDVAFDYDGQEWDLMLKADVSLTDIVKGDFQHVIDTFKILE